MPRPQTAGAGTALAAMDTAWQSIGAAKCAVVSRSCQAGLYWKMRFQLHLEFGRNWLHSALRRVDSVRYPARTDAWRERDRETHSGVYRPVRGAARALAGVSLLPPRRTSSYLRREGTFSDQSITPTQ